MRPVSTPIALVALILTLIALPALAQSSGAVNVNTASAGELELLPRVGPSVAQRILDFRAEHGKFQQVEDLLLVQGIGEKTFTLLKPFVAISGETTLKEKVRLSELSGDGEAP